MNLTSYELTILSLFITFGGVGVAMLSIIIKLLGETMAAFRKQLTYQDRKINIVANYARMDLVDLDEQARGKG